MTNYLGSIVEKHQKGVVQKEAPLGSLYSISPTTARTRLTGLDKGGSPTEQAPG